VVALDAGGPAPAAGLDHVGVERALDEELHLLAVLVGGRHQVARGLLEDADELASDDLALGLRVGHAGQCVEEALLRVDDHEVHAGRGDEVALDLLGLALRSNPWSTNTQVSCSPTARWTRAAATAESTPPESPQIARLSPTCARIAATCSSITFAIVQVGRQPATS
jgi:hypothetical protein